MLSLRKPSRIVKFNFSQLSCVKTNICVKTQEWERDERSPGHSEAALTQ